MPSRYSWPASGVQVCTAAILHRLGVFGKIAHELEAWLDEHGHASASELQGLAIERMPVDWASGLPVVLEEPCNGYDLCVQVCPYHAIELVQKLALIDLAACTRCGLCLTRCRRGTIE